MEAQYHKTKKDLQILMQTFLDRADELKDSAEPHEISRIIDNANEIRYILINSFDDQSTPSQILIAARIVDNY